MKQLGNKVNDAKRADADASINQHHSLTKEITAYALKNAIEFGKADPGKILPKLFQHGLEKNEIKTVMPEVQKIVKEINSMSKKDREKNFDSLKSLIPEKAEESHELPELPRASKKMVFRLAPFPSGALHIGNAKTFLINAMYAEKYEGKTLLVIDDTIGSAEKQIAPEAYKLIEEAFNWLQIKYAKPVVYKSDRLKIYYDHAEKLIKKNAAYVCHCSQEKLRKNREEGIECGCRQFPADVQILRWKEMFKEKEGHAVLRIKTSMQHPNPAFRDRVLFKISDREHPRVKHKYRVWPTLEMSWAVDDHLLGITHIIRGNDLMIETDMEKFIWNIFGWKHPETIHTGFLNLEGTEAKLSKSKAQAEVKSGKFSGWDDPRTWSIQSLARRGILPEAIRQLIKEIGLNKQNISLPIDALYAINRKIIDSGANRFSFVRDPVKIIIKNQPEIKSVNVPIHPDKPEERTVRVGEIFISRTDLDLLGGGEIRLLHLFNMKLDDKKPEAKFTSVENKNIPKINWVSGGVPCSILMPDGNIVDGFAEDSIKTLKYNEIVQFERFGFVKLDNVQKEGKYEFWFAHR